MSDVFDFERMELPRFFVVDALDNNHDMPVGTVMAESSLHHSSGWLTVGFVSRQTPFGQGIYCGFPLDQLRRANRDEVLAVLKSDHIYGRDFRPSCRDASNAIFHLVMSKAIGNWTSDTPLMQRWAVVTAKQRLLIRREYV